ncbi:MAG: type II secretion system F family protein [Pirellulaceae bacterium]|nr:type II secretion system F family protein [Pirellulaceae bacterium]
MVWEAVDGIGVLGSLALGGAVVVVVWWILRALAPEDLAQADEWRYDVSRMNALRRSDLLYRLFFPAIQILAKLNRAAWQDRLRGIDREIQAAGISRYWLPEEYLARAELIALLLLPLYMAVCVSYMGPAGAVSALMASVLTVWFLRRSLRRRAIDRLVSIKRRLPFLLDLLTLLMEAGANFHQALRQGVREFAGQDVAVEFARVLTDINMGKTRVEAFDSLRRRLNDDEINGIIGAILQSEQLGTPLSQIFRTQADVLRLKRSQRAETIAGEAGVKMLLPGVLVMISTVIIILGPFVLNYWLLGLGL